MKLYDENNEMNNENKIPEAGQNEVKNTSANDVQNVPAAEQKPEETAAPAAAPTADPAAMPAEHTEPAAEPAAEPAQTAAPRNEPYVQNPQPQSGSYSYTRENIPDNTYRTPSAGQNGSYNGSQNGSQNQTPYGQQNPYGQGQPQNGYAQNGYGQNGGYQQNPYGGQQSGYHQNPYGQNPGGQNPYAQGPYGGQNQYNPMQDGGRISYTPDKKTAKKAKKKGGGKKAAVAVACCAGLLLSTGFGFLGAVIANRVFPAQTYQDDIAADKEGNVSNDTQGTAVFYKSVEDLATSTNENGGDLTMAQVSALVADTVVEITTEYTVTGWFQYVSQGAGSGVILSEDGYVITNNHVICGEDGVTPADAITVRLTNGEEYDARLIGTDADSDVAILKIEASGLTPAILGNSDNLVVGETVLAVGNPLGELGGTQTDGIISALDREIDVNGTNMTLLQTSAAVNPGNSGGALFNMRGELIGVVNAKSSGTGIEGLGFAIPINDAINVSEQLMEYGYVRGKVMIGVTPYEVTDAMTARMLGLNNYGVYVYQLADGYNEDVLQVGDRIVSVDGQEITTADDLTSLVKSHSVGDVLKFQISRGGKLMEVDVTCYEKVPELGEVDFEQQ